MYKGIVLYISTRSNTNAVDVTWRQEWKAAKFYMHRNWIQIVNYLYSPQAQKLYFILTKLTSSDGKCQSHNNPVLDIFNKPHSLIKSLMPSKNECMSYFNNKSLQAVNFEIALTLCRLAQHTLSQYLNVNHYGLGWILWQLFTYF